MEGYVVIYVILGVLVLVGGLMYWGWVEEKKRRHALQAFADELGFEFFADGDLELQASLVVFHLFQIGDSKRLFNLMRGSTNNLDMLIFDYSYSVGSGKSRTTVQQTVLCFEIPEDSLPHFSLRPEDMWHKIGSWFGYQDIDFDSHPVFSRKYLLRGADEDAIRERFTSNILEWLEGVDNLSVEGNGNRLLVYRGSRRPAPDDIRKLMEEGFEVMNLFRDA